MTGVRWSESVRRRKLHGVADVPRSQKDSQFIEDALIENDQAQLNDRGSLILNDDNDESRRTVENCYRTRKVLVNPIVDWDEEDVWEFLNDVAKVPHCELYDQGYTRLGCIGCPMIPRIQWKELEKYPKYKANYMRAFEKMLDVRKQKGKADTQWKNAEEVYKWFAQERFYLESQGKEQNDESTNCM